jgi:hypothetical protein
MVDRQGELEGIGSRQGGRRSFDGVIHVNLHAFVVSVSLICLMTLCQLCVSCSREFDEMRRMGCGVGAAVVALKWWRRIERKEAELSNYGYSSVFLGCVLEIETSFVMSVCPHGTVRLPLDGF